MAMKAVSSPPPPALLVPARLGFLAIFNPSFGATDKSLMTESSTLPRSPPLFTRPPHRMISCCSLHIPYTARIVSECTICEEPGPPAPDRKRCTRYKPIGPVPDVNMTSRLFPLLHLPPIAICKEPSRVRQNPPICSRLCDRRGPA